MFATPNTPDNFQRSFFRGLMERLPYRNDQQQPQFPIDKLNPKFSDFSNASARRETALRKHSVSSDTLGMTPDVAAKAFMTKANAFLYQALNEQKVQRNREYNTLASYEYVKDALDEIANEFFNPDSKGRVCLLNIKNLEEKPESKELLTKEFDKYIGYFRFDDDGTKQIKQFLNCGEVFFEQIVHKDYMEQGVLGVVPISPDLIEPLYVNVVTEELECFVLKKPIYDVQNPNMIRNWEIIPMQKSQVVYIHTDDWNPDKTYRVPHIENCRRAFRQLSLIEDSIIIYRLVNAPERLVFHIDTGNMPGPKAEEYLRQMSMDWWSNKTYNAQTGDVTQQYNPQSMTDAIWLPKRQGSEGSSVEKLAGGQNLGELQDLQYFAQKLFKSLKVPTSRLQSDNTYRDGTDILREELKFATFIIDMQRKFARAIKNGFIAHLKLKGLMDKCDITENDIDIEFFKPTNFYEMRDAKRLEIRIQNYSTITSDGFISKTLAQKEYLKLTDDEIKANRHLLREDAKLEWELTKIKAAGPNWMEVEAAVLQNGAAPGGAPGGDMGGIGGGGGGSVMPPDFGGAPIDVGSPAPGGEPSQSANNPSGEAFGMSTGSEDMGTEGLPADKNAV